MTNLLIKLFIKDSNGSGALREKYGVLSGIVGIVLNIILSVFKVICGAFTKSVSIIADGINNLFDAVSSIISLLGFKISGKPADKDHPYGHGRTEYLSALALGTIIIFTGVELIKTSINKLKNPEPVSFSIVAVVILVVAILGKIWLACFNTTIGKKINSVSVDAVVADSLGDIAATICTLIALVASRFTSLPLDGIMGIIVALVVLYAGFGVFKDTLGPLLGEPPDKEVVDNIEKTVMSHDGILGIHDVILHCYGAGKIYGSLHAEVPSDGDIMLTHDLIDNIEMDLRNDFGYEISIHMDPINCNDELTNSLKALAKDTVKSIDKEITIHDFRIVTGPTHTNLIFDAVLPFKFRLSDDEFVKEVNRILRKEKDTYYCVINVDKKYF